MNRLYPPELQLNKSNTLVFGFEFTSNFSAGRPKAAPLFCLLLVVLLARSIPVVVIVYICLIRILALRPPVLQFQLPALPLVCVLFVLFLLFVVVLSGEPSLKQGQRLVDHKLVQAPPPASVIIPPAFMPRGI